MQTPLVSRSQPEDIERLVAVIVAAFRADPFVRWMLPDEARYEEAFSRLSLGIAALAVEHQSARHTGDSLAAALWLPPGVESPGGEWFMAAVPEERHAALEEVGRQMDGALPAQAHWHLRLLGVEPAAQGRGLGSELLRESLAASDALHEAAYLESTSPGSKALYERHGFAVTAEIQAGDSPPLWPMLRPPR
jgi:ribosomal protein S18 acetylase RimI-like enzyme